jgi:Glycoside hydrolase family 44/Bacterial Ig-like domain (group 3)
MRRILSSFARYWAATLLFAIAATQPSVAQTTPVLTADAAGNPHPINPDVYGIANYGLDAGFAKEIQVPNIRWGGDGTTRYNWQVDSSNSGFDWYFMGGNGEATATPSASADLMIDTYKAASNAHTLLTIPIIPYVNKSAAWSCSFPVSVYGAQQSTNPYVHPSGDNCGNSITTAGAQLIDNNIYANHIDNTVALQQGWLQHLIATFGTAANGGVPYYQLDNEPGGWSNTHRDVEPDQPDYNTIISLGQQYAAMIKQTDPTAKVFGPVDFTLGGWIGTPSQQNGLYAGQYYLQQMAAYDQANHQRILDYFDEHYYGGGSTDAAELASTRALWDPTFNSGSWVEQYYFDGPMMLLPRFQNWIQTYYPGTKLSISEYSFSSGTNPLVDALTEADVLGIYGRQSLDFANLWTVPQPTDPVAFSFRLYRNYDGAGGQFGNTSVNSTSTDQGQLSVYGALRSSDGALTVVAINKTTSAIQTSLTLANFNSSAPAAVYTYSNANLAQIVAGTPVAVVSDALNYNFPAYSATVFVFTPEASASVATATSLTASATQATSGQAVTFTAVVAPKSGSGVPTGTVAFSDGATQIGTASLNSSGSAAFDTSSLAIGSHSISAAYSGDANFAGSTSAAVSITISAPAKIATTTSVLASATQLAAGQNVTFTAGVAPQTGTGVPTGSITFLDGQAQIAVGTLNGGAASFSRANLAVGSHTITAAYSGDSNYATSSSTALTVTVTTAASADYSLSMSSSALSVAPGSSGNLTITVTPKNGFKQAVGFACSGLPSGGGCTFNPQTVDPVAGAVSTTLTVQLPAAAGTTAPATALSSGSRTATLYIFFLAILGIVGAAGIKQSVTRDMKLARAFLTSAVFAALLATANCAGYVGQKTSQPPTYVVTVSASGANAPTHTQQFTLTVMP